MSLSRHLYLHTGNRLEELAAALARGLAATEEGDPLAAPVIAVPSIGTARWLAMEVARHRGIACRLRFPFPRQVIDELLAAALGGEPPSPDFGPEAVAWWAFDRLPSLAEKPAFAAVRGYLADGDARKRHQLARGIGALFDQYQVYRPDLLHSWETDAEPGNWQAELWRALRADTRGRRCLPDLLRHLATAAGGDGSGLQGRSLPRQLHWFGTGVLPPAFLDVLHALSPWVRIDFYLLQPTPAYWGDLVTRKRALAAPADAPLEVGHPFAASLGRAGQDMLNLLVDREFQQTEELFTDPGEARLLNAIQHDVLDLSDRTAPDAARRAIDPGDDSIVVASCHSPAREVEALHDHLLALFAEDRTLRPRDVLVLAPEIEDYAPHIEAVFGAPESEALRLPYSIADRRPRSRFAVVDAFLRVLEVARSRFTAPEVLAVLEAEPLRRRFGLGEDDLARIRVWINECGIAWGIDAAHRRHLGLPDGEEHTWRRGLDTLISGYALNGDGPRLLEWPPRETGRAPSVPLQPYADLEGDHAATLGRLADALDVLAQAAAGLREARPRADWADHLRELANTLFGDDPACAADLRSIHGVLAALRQPGPGDPTTIVDTVVILDHLEQNLAEATAPGGFLDGRITFASLRPLRSIPAPIICLLGMNDAAFPRRPGRPDFDLIARAPRRGDRSPAAEDRFLFLETLLGARRQLYLSYVGQSARSNESAPPSVVVAELLDYARRAFALPEAVRERLDRRHHLQAFHPAYFCAGPGQSFSTRNAAAARRLREPPRPRRFVAAPLPPPPDELRTVSPEALARFFQHPSRAFCELRLRLRPLREAERVDGREPVELDHLERYELEQGLAEQRLGGGVGDDLLAAAAARGRLPPGPAGALVSRVVARRVAKFAAAVEAEARGATPETLAVDHPFTEEDGRIAFRLSGPVSGVRDGRLLVFRCAKAKPKDEIRAWVLHLAANLVRPGTPTVLIDGEGGRQQFTPPADADALLRPLLELYWQGLSEPLRFFPNTSLAYQRQIVAPGRSNLPPLRVAWRAWVGDENRGDDRRPPGDGEDEHHRLLHGEQPPLDESFRRLADAIGGPLYQHLLGKAES